MQQHQKFQCEKHNDKTSIYLCCNELCKKSKIFCYECLKLDHQEHLFDIKKLIKSEINGYIDIQSFDQQRQKLIEKLSQHFVEWNSLQQMLQQRNRLNSQNNINQIDFNINKLQISENLLKIMKLLQNNLDKSFSEIQEAKKQLMLPQQQEIKKQSKITIVPNQVIDLPIIQYQIYKEGIQLSNQNKSELALKYFNFVLEDYPKIIECLYQKGCVLNTLKQYKQSVDCFNQVLNIRVQHVEALLKKGEALKQLNQLENAYQCIKLANDIDPKNIHILNELGKILYEQNKYDEAIQYFNQVLNLDKQNLISLDNKSKALSELLRYDEALKCIDSALLIYPENKDLYYQKALFLWKQNKEVEAKKIISEKGLHEYYMQQGKQ